MNSRVIELSEYIHPEEKKVTAKIVSMTEMSSWAESFMGDNLDDVNQYICTASFFRIPSDHFITVIAKQAAERFGVDNLPELYVARRFSYNLQLSGYKVPTIVIPSVLLDEKDDDMIDCRINAALASIKAGHHQLEFLLWFIENMSRTIPLPFVGQAACALLYEWKRVMLYTQDRAVFLATGSLEKSLRNILYGTVPTEMLRNFEFGSNGTFEPQVERYSNGVIENTAGAVASLLQDHAYLPERYKQIIRFAEGRAHA